MTELSERLATHGRGVLEQLRRTVPRMPVAATTTRLGRVVEAGDGVATIVGLSQPAADALLDIEGVPARAEMVAEEETRAVLLGSVARVQAGARVRQTGRILDVPAGIELVGRVVDPLGDPLDRRGPVRSRRRVAIDGEITPLSEREPVHRPLRTGVFVLDTMIPVGRGQRQLVVGDRSTGKTELCLDILAGLEREVIGVYVAIGRRGADTAAAIGWLEERQFFTRGFAVVANADQPVGLVQLAPYAAMAMAEELTNQGRDVVVVFDDLTAHAHAHRTLALLLGRPVGREAYPVDVFYAHAQLLERAAQLGRRRGGGSLTALPIIETQAGDLTAYIPTNLVSITDGQIRLDAALVARSQLPAVDVGLSVSRVGSKAQPPWIRRLAGPLRHRYAQFLELEMFSRFGARVEAHAQQVLAWGQRVRAVLGQGRGATFDWADTTVALQVLADSRISSVPLESFRTFVESVGQILAETQRPVWERLSLASELRAEDAEAVTKAIGDALERGSGS
ncbi:MAG: F0F1 ATP synthase subunit alpha [Myxococcales bacterium FL481]|nr:MAG: F0F1 ATP synthase subunit alpha [Myxococcales bacterium FL481]